MEITENQRAMRDINSALENAHAETLGQPKRTPFERVRRFISNLFGNKETIYPDGSVDARHQWK